MRYMDAELRLETYKSLVTYGAAGLRFVLTANGAAAIAILTFIGHFVAASKVPVPDLRVSLAFFVSGVVFGGIATMTAYWTQLRIYNGPIDSPSTDRTDGHEVWFLMTLILISVGIAVFGIGAIWAVNSLY
jgi:hypothetical protein